MYNLLLHITLNIDRFYYLLLCFWSDIVRSCEYILQISYLK